MKLRDYLSDRLYQILMHLAAMLALSVFLLITGTAPDIVLLLLTAWGIGLFLLLAAGYIRADARLRELGALMQGLEKKYLFAECAPPPRSRYERQLFALLRRSGKSMLEAVSDAEAEQKDYREYIENWVHEIKAPITSARLMCRNDTGQLGRRLATPLGQIEEHVERALYYARAGTVERDFAVCEASLDDIVGSAVARHKALLIQKGISVETEHLDEPVYTDPKWLGFMLGQLLANAARYSKADPVIRITGRRLGCFVQLNVWDNGIGMPKHDLPRIFEKGFTGENGRKTGGATGMGLYIVKKLCAHLQIELAAASEEGTYTCITLSIPAKENLSKL